MEQKDYYQILGVAKDAGSRQIKDAYRELALKYHPDRNRKDPLNAEKMKEINEAYAVLSNSEKKREYDMMRQQFGSSAYSRFRKSYNEEEIFSGSDINHIFEEIAKSFGLRGFDDIFKEFYGHRYRTFEFKKPGIYGGGFIFSAHFGKGRQPLTQSPLLGNLGRLPGYILKKISGIQLPEKGADINDVIYLNPRQAKEGGPYAYFHQKRSIKLIVKIPPGVRQGQKIRLAGMGNEGKMGGKSGDLYLKVHIKKPLFQKIKDLVTDLRK